MDAGKGQDRDSGALASFLGADRSDTIPHRCPPKAHCVTLEQQVKCQPLPRAGRPARLECRALVIGPDVITLLSLVSRQADQP